MSPTVDAFFRSWPFDPWLLASLILSAAIYLRGWRILRGRDPLRWDGKKLAAFLAGLGLLFLALGSPVEPFGSLLLQVHMIQHLLLMMAAPPLLWLGDPLFPMLRGLPRPFRNDWIVPLFRSPTVRRVFAWLSQPGPALAIYVAATWFWHIPAIYDAALSSGGLHKVQHLCFLGSSLLFWFLVVRPYPFRPRWSPWLLVPYLLLADVSNTVLSALLTFSDRVLYPHYGQIPRIGRISALDDQAAAGVLMWVPGSVVFLFPLFVIGTRLLFGGSGTGQALTKRRPASDLPILQTSRPGFDLLSVPIVGRFLRWRHARRAFQLVTAGLAVAVIVDGLTGTQVAPMNLAGGLPWIHWRGFLILGLLAVGNLSCMACPFTLPRTLARRRLPAGRHWPRRLRSKWLGVILVGLFFWAYEAFSLWDDPRMTAWIIVGYFVAAFVIDAIYRGASFCKYVCPIGQFNFVQSLVSPLEVKVKDATVCDSCRTKECIRGTSTGISGCALELYLPQKSGNLDCTLCLDCVHACSHDNIGILAAYPASGTWNEGRHSGIGRLKDRPDLAALVLVLVFGAFANAGGMIAPVQDLQQELTARLGLRDPLAITTAYYLLALVVAPWMLFKLAAAIDGRETATRFSFALVPLGFGMWLAHYGYHLLTSYRSAIPALQRFAAGFGWRGLGPPRWIYACCQPAAEWLPRMEILCLDLGLLLSLYCGYRIATGSHPSAWRAFLPWAVVIVLLFATGVWIVLQPMQMRGTLPRLGG